MKQLFGKLPFEWRVVGILGLTLSLMYIVAIALITWWNTRLAPTNLQSVSAVKLPESFFPLNLKWQIDLKGPTYESPTYQDGLVFIPAANDIFGGNWYGIEANTGKTVWTQLSRGKYTLQCLNAENLVISSDPSPSYSGDASSLMAIKTQTGKVAWLKEERRTVTCSNSLVLLGGSRGWLETVTIENGRERWSGTTPQEGFDQWEVIYNWQTDQFFARDREQYYFIAASTGQLGKFVSDAEIDPEDQGSFIEMLVIDNGQLFMNVGAEVVTLDAQNGEVLHRENRYGPFQSQIITKDTIYAYTDKMGVIALDRKTFEMEWNYPRPQSQSGTAPKAISSLVVLDGVGYLIFSDVILRAIELESGHELGYWQPKNALDLPWRVKAGLTASTDTLFVSFGDGKLYAFGL